MNPVARIVGAAGAAVLVALAVTAHAADTETADLPEGILAKMARISAKQGVDRGAPGMNAGDRLRGAGGGGASPACGSLNVGNVNTGGRRVGQPVREVVVVIKGDVINANNKCR